MVYSVLMREEVPVSSLRSEIREAQAEWCFKSVFIRAKYIREGSHLRDKQGLCEIRR